MKFMMMKKRFSRRGTIVVLLAVCLMMIMGFVAIAVDGGLLLDQRRQVQSAADASAMAGACVLYSQFPTNKGLDSGNSAVVAALNQAAANGYITNGNSGNGNNGNGNNANSNIIVNIPPQSGLYAGQPSYIEVIITYQQPRYFSRIWGSDTIPVTARAVARGAWTGDGIGVLVLNYTGKAALNDQGNGAFTEANGYVIVNSNNSSAAVDGGNGGMTATDFFITGDATVNGGGSFTTVPTPGQIFQGVHPTPDPLAYLPAPSMPPPGTITAVKNASGNGTTYTLTPGSFTNLPSFTQGDTVIFGQASANGNGGIYFINGGGLKSTGANLLMDPATTGGMMIYNNPLSTANSEAVQITGNSSGTVNLSALTGGPYQGIMIWQDRSAPQTMSLQGNGLFNMSGTLYVAGGLLSITGNGGQYAAADGTIGSGSAIGSQYISLDLNIGGNGNIHLAYPGRAAPTRILTLVE